MRAIFFSLLLVIFSMPVAQAAPLTCSAKLLTELIKPASAQAQTCEDGCYNDLHCTGQYMGNGNNEQQCRRQRGLSYCFAGSCWNVNPR